MFGVFKPGEKSTDDRIDAIATELFAQIEQARDEAKSRGIVDEKVFNDRLNSMFVAGYLISYVDECLSDMEGDNAAKKQAAEHVFETMFPGSGVDFVKTRLIARQKAPAIPKEDPNLGAIAEQCRVFDAGMLFAQEEVEKIGKDKGYHPSGLKRYLLLGETL
ncbi:MAG TPA: hypothetical protein VJ969_07760 [Desulfopila sp.]|nr:hypothetical protein [Desulfopila sp.]